MAALEIPGRQVVENRIAKDVFVRFRFRNVSPSFSDDDGELALVIKLCGLRRERDLCVGSHDSGGRFGEKDRIGGDVRPPLFRMVGVVSPDAEDVLARPDDRGKKCIPRRREVAIVRRAAPNAAKASITREAKRSRARHHR